MEFRVTKPTNISFRGHFDEYNDFLVFHAFEQRMTIMCETHNSWRCSYKIELHFSNGLEILVIHHPHLMTFHISHAEPAYAIIIINRIIRLYPDNQEELDLIIDCCSTYPIDFSDEMKHMYSSNPSDYYEVRYEIFRLTEVLEEYIG